MFLHIAIVAALFQFSLVSANSEWGYPNMEVDEEFPKWGGLCDNGVQQSPIDLSLNGAFKSDFKKLKFENYDKRQQSPLMVNNGHTIQLYDFPQPMKLYGGPLTDVFIVEQIHFHWWSEHTINKIRYPLECHIVHRNLKYANMSEAAKHKDGIAVVGILYHVSNQLNVGIKDVLDYIDEVKNYEHLGKPIKMTSFQISELLPKLNGYFTYAGSLTTPTCAETVTWLMLQQTLPVTLEQVNKFKEVEHDKGKLLLNNYRFVQKRHNRAVVAVTYDADNHDEENSAAGIQMSIGLIAFMAICKILL